MRKIEELRNLSGAKSVLALKCFSAWAVFPLMREYMDGTTSSSLLEARLGYEKFGKETHAYSVGFTHDEVREVAGFADKIIFNSLSQFSQHRKAAGKIRLGLRVNPGISHSHFDLADPARKYSRLGVVDLRSVERIAHRLSGLMFHFNCENDDIRSLEKMLDKISARYGKLMNDMEWVSLGGGIYFTKPGFPLGEFAALLGAFSRKHGVQIYLEPGESAITDSAELCTTVLDVVRNDGLDIAIVDSSTEAHMLDLLIYRQEAKLAWPLPGRSRMMIAGRSCLAGDVFGTYRIRKRLRIGDVVRFRDAAGYTMVKKNWFNGLPMPSIAVRRLDGKIEVVRRFSYVDYKKNLS
jgi:carboxynorspermidine decarboxylase